MNRERDRTTYIEPNKQLEIFSALSVSFFLYVLSCSQGFQDTHLASSWPSLLYTQRVSRTLLHRPIAIAQPRPCIQSGVLPPEGLSHTLCAPAHRPAPIWCSANSCSPASALVSQSRTTLRLFFPAALKIEKLQRTRVAPSCFQYCTCRTDLTRECLGVFKVPTDAPTATASKQAKLDQVVSTKDRPSCPTTCPVFG